LYALFILLRKRHTVVIDYPAQEKPPRGLQLLLAELVEPEEDAPKETTFESFFWVFGLAHLGQTGSWSASEKRSIFSNASPHSLQRYS